MSTPDEREPEVHGEIRRIMESPTYRRADRDLDFLAHDDLRPVRLEIEFMKPEVFLRQSGVRSTIVVFGGTRIVEPGEARQRVETLRREVERHPEEEGARRRLEVAERVLAKSHYYDVAREFGRIVGSSGYGSPGSRLLVVTGGGPGLMEAANRGAHDAGADSVGLNITLPHEQYPNAYITPELCFHFRYFALRKMHFLLRARALVAFPGGFGTLDELFDALCLVQTEKIKPLPIVLVGEEYWRGVFDAEFLAREGTIAPGDVHLFWYAETAQEIWDGILRWYADRNEPLLSAEQKE